MIQNSTLWKSIATTVDGLAATGYFDRNPLVNLELFTKNLAKIASRDKAKRKVSQQDVDSAVSATVKEVVTLMVDIAVEEDQVQLGVNAQGLLCYAITSSGEMCLSKHEAVITATIIVAQ